jgi:predicted ATPase/DNA-binding XRE family transcriptional regulator
LLKRHRLAAGLTHESLAERAGLSVRTISDLERGVSRGPRSGTLGRIVAALQLPADDRAAFEAAARWPADPDAERPVAGRGPGSLPVPLTSFVGREQETRLLRDLLRRGDIRLVSLTGPGGTGKTRLGIRAAEQLQPAFRHGVFYAPLAPVADPERIVPAIFRALGSVESNGEASLPDLIDFLGDRELLLLLDNFEHLLPASTLVVDLLRHCPRLKVLVTSRAVLRVSGEQELPVAPLPLPDAGRLPPVEVLARYAAIRLFVERAKRVRPDFKLTSANAEDVADICARLDGLPLAIELAAPRIRVFSPRALRARLRSGSSPSPLSLLTGGAQDLPERQRTLRDTIAWSYDLLTDSEQRLYRRLAVFVGSCAVDAVEVVAERGAQEVVETLASLVEKSLVRQEDGPDGEPRFAMLETVREFGMEQLQAHGEAAEVQRRHAEHYLAMVESTGALLFATERERVRMSFEQDNIQAALRWLVRHG